MSTCKKILTIQVGSTSANKLKEIVALEAVLESCAGLDVHQETVVACVMAGPVEGRPQKETMTFKTTTSGLLELSDWLQGHGCSHVAMESTGVYWKPVWHVLEGSFELILANARHIKNVPGRKTDVKDAEWIAQLLRCGLITSSHVPPENIRDLRDLTRYRKKLLGNALAEKNRIHKILQDANIKLSSYMSDVFGVTGRTLLEAIINGEMIDTEYVERVAKGQLKNKVPLLVEALNGRLRKHHRNMIRFSWSHLMYIEKAIHQVESDIECQLEPYYEEVELLKTIPGVKKEAAATIIAELGVDMSVFPTAQHAASWAGLCPGNYESAGKKKSGRTRKISSILKATLAQCAWTTTRMRGTRLAARFWGIAKRKGRPKALVATAHTILIVAYHILKDRRPYEEHGEDYLAKRKQQKSTSVMINELTKLGYEITKGKEVS